LSGLDGVWAGWRNPERSRRTSRCATSAKVEPIRRRLSRLAKSWAKPKDLKMCHQR